MTVERGDLTLSHRVERGTLIVELHNGYGGPPIASTKITKDELWRVLKYTPEAPSARSPSTTSYFAGSRRSSAGE